LLAVVGAAGLWFVFRRHPVEENAGTLVDSVFSQDGGRAVLITREAGITHVWLQPRGGARLLVTRLNPEESARSVTWSPDGRLAAFETFNPDGHSPMTTTHVQVLDVSSGLVHEVRLPPPNERFSTHFVEWAGNDLVRIRSTLPDIPEDRVFIYDCHTGEVRDGAG
jgi:Tol biopolymer transport system component